MSFLKKVGDFFSSVFDDEPAKAPATRTQQRRQTQQTQQPKVRHATRSNRGKGMAIKKAITVPIVPLLTDTYDGSGGVQGLHWLSRSLITDATGSCAQDFFRVDRTGRFQAEKIKRRRTLTQNFPNTQLVSICKEDGNYVLGISLSGPPRKSQL